MDFSYLAFINMALNGAMLLYVIKIEKRFTKLETQMAFILKNGHKP